LKEKRMYGKKNWKRECHKSGDRKWWDYEK